MQARDLILHSPFCSVTPRIANKFLIRLGKRNKGEVLPVL
jgi:hypothetical protein